MELPLLLAALPDPYVACGAIINGAHVRRIVTDSRDAGPGAVFVAVNHRGYARDGHDFVADAISRGVSVVVAERVVPAPETVVVITVPSTARALAWMSAAVEGFPASRLALIGITGTDGKTTTGVMTHAILDRAGM
ncbi:MAG: UDP-N-acetylmuramoyl-L-alanyl-D-glutamate--2,6-diaminopimelate ligase, partial [Chloroflexi bacterium]|nr:UDP-N-acetylmuramoyl-L-alanyl-D-glutamate--2,6-diaminopimelate ligase [Chloroflexota bacterium]